MSVLNINWPGDWKGKAASITVTAQGITESTESRRGHGKNSKVRIKILRGISVVSVLSVIHCQQIRITEVGVET